MKDASKGNVLFVLRILFFLILGIVIYFTMELRLESAILLFVLFLILGLVSKVDIVLMEGPDLLIRRYYFYAIFKRQYRLSPGESISIREVDISDGEYVGYQGLSTPLDFIYVFTPKRRGPVRYQVTLSYFDGQRESVLINATAKELDMINRFVG